MSKRQPEELELRRAFIRLLAEIRERHKPITNAEIADVLRVKRQTLWLYSKGRVTPGGEVIKRACDHWDLRLTIKGFEFTGSAFELKKRLSVDKLPVQQSLFDVLETLTSRNVEAKVVGRVGDSFCLQITIRKAV